MNARGQTPSTRQVFLGLFVIGQLVFLVLRNGLELVEEARRYLPEGMHASADHLAPGWRQERGHLNNLLETLERATKTYAEATEQLQSWSLFAPSVGQECVFPALLLRWDEDEWSTPVLKNPLMLLGASDIMQALGLASALEKDQPAPPSPSAAAVAEAMAGFAASRSLEAAILLTALEKRASRKMPRAPELFLSDNEPVDMANYFRLGMFRLRRYETMVVKTLMVHGDETEAEAKERWTSDIREHLDKYGDHVLAYMRWRMEQVLKRTGAPGPAQVIFLVRRFHVADPGEAPPFAVGPHMVPVARWRPGQPADKGPGSLEAYDPVTGSFRVHRK